MLLAFVILLLIIGLGIMASMYSIFLPFYQNLGDLTDYNVAYYGANSSLERGLLVTKYQDPGFEGSGGRLSHTNYGPPSDAEFDHFARFNYNQNGILRTINSRTTQIPTSGQGNVPHLLAGTGSENYNILDYQNTEVFIMSTDDTNDVNDYYKQESNPHITAFQGTEAIGTVRIPPKIYTNFGDNDNALLCDDENISYCDINQDDIYNEAIVTRGVNGIYHPGQTDEISFSILPSTAVFFNTTPSIIDVLHDNNFREDSVNYTTYTSTYPANINFSNLDYFNPVIRNTPYLLNKHNVIAESGSTIETQTFTHIFQNAYSKINLNINHLLMSKNQNIYPFLEYKFEFDNEISDRFFHINGYGKVGNYNVNIVINKPNVDQSIVGDFTIIF